mgnify:CR=1 FL=1
MKPSDFIITIVSLAISALTATAQETWTLQRCIDHAKEQNIIIKQRRVSVEQAELSVRDARAERLPGVSFSTSQSFNNRPFAASSSMINGSQVVTTSHKNTYTGSYGISASMPLYDGGKINNTVRLNQLESRIAELNVDAAELSIEEEITRVYIQILYSSEAITQDDEQIALSQAQVDRARALFDAGLLNRADVAQLESQLANDRYQRVADETTLSDYTLQLKQLLELDGDTTLVVADPDITTDALAPLPIKANVYAAALESRPEVKAQLLALDRSALDETIARAGMLPSLSLNAGMNSNNSSGNGNMFTQLKNQWSNAVGVTLSIPIYDRGKTRNAIARARLEREQAELDLQNTRKTLWKSIETYHLNATSAQQRYLAALEREKAARTSYELTSEQFRLGLKNIVELQTDKTALSAAVQQTLQAKYMAALNGALLRLYAR